MLSASIIILGFIPSKISYPILESDYVIDISHEDFIFSGLRKASTLKLDHLITVKTSIIQRELG